jgi:electron transfer flavoprotein alpha subunit
MKTWVYIDHFQGAALPASWEAIGLGKTLGPVTALVFGSGVEALAKTAFEYGADEVPGNWPRWSPLISRPA